MATLAIHQQFTLKTGAAAGGAAGSPSPSPFASIELETLNDKGEAVLQNYINNSFVPAASGLTIEDFNPATGKVHAVLPRSAEADLEAAAKAAKAAFPAWSKTSAAHRADLLDRIADAIEAHAAALAAIESADSGKTIRMASAVDIPRSVANFRFFAGQIRHDETSCFAMQDAINYTTRVPLGVAGLISAWNLPLYLLSWKIAPALACGNCVVAKPSEITPRTANVLSRLIHAVGLPAGVFNLVHGLGAEAGQALVAQPDINLISFTGGTATGKIVAATAAPLFKKVSLELGGKNATVIFGDVDLAKVVPGAVRAAFTNNGQVCLCGSRIFVHSSIYKQFQAMFVEQVQKMKCGDPSSFETDVGPVSSAAHKEKIEYYVKLGQEEGGTVLCGGDRPAELPAGLEGGYFINPCVIGGLPYTARCAQEEIFGPVCTLHSFDSEDEVVEAVNSVRYGLAGSIWTENLTLAHRVCRRIESGILWVNCWLHRDLRTPFGGVKDSGIGREGGKYSLDFYSEWKNVCVFMGSP